MRGIVAALALTLHAGAAAAQERVYIPRDLGIDCVRAPCRSWQVRDERGVLTTFAGLEFAPPLAPTPALLADLAAGRLLVRGELIRGRFPKPDTQVPVLRVTAIIGPAPR